MAITSSTFRSARVPRRSSSPSRPLSGLRIVVGQLSRDRREPLDLSSAQAGATTRRPGARPRRRALVEDRPEDRERAVGVVDEVEQPRLLRPVDVRRVTISQKPPSPGPRVRRDPVAVLVPDHERDDAAVPQEQALDRLRRTACTAAAEVHVRGAVWTMLTIGWCPNDDDRARAAPRPRVSSASSQRNCVRRRSPGRRCRRRCRGRRSAAPASA